MNQVYKEMEILAPAGSYDSLVAAVRCGADAVYLGSKSLNARRNAGNFDDVELERAVVYCHERGVRVYQTLNIVMFENEVEETIGAIETAARLGVDAVLVQDFGVAELCRQCAPQLPVYASTQMAIHNLSGARKAQELGYKRVVLAREMRKEEIAAVTQGTDLETEVFVHGALCMSVSGQCYLSSMIGQRSGNRGLCAQPCRLPFQAEGGEQYGLSLKDLTLVSQIGELRALGVNSLKIEGRMKRPEYVAAAVTALRCALNGQEVDFDTLRSVFSRNGFTSGYFDGKLDAAMFGVRQKEDVVAAAEVLGDLARSYDKETPLVPMDAHFTLEPGHPAQLQVRDDHGNEATATGQVPEVAIRMETDLERARGSLGKTGNTPFYLRKLTGDVSPGLMLPASALNGLRRDALDELLRQRGTLKPLAFADSVERIPRAQSADTAPTLRARLTLSQLSPEVLDHCQEVILPLAECEKALELDYITKENILIEIPRILFAGEEQVAEKLAELKALGLTRAWAGNLGAIKLAQDAGLEACGGWSLNLTNAYSLTALEQMGVRETELSFELTLDRAKAIHSGLRKGILGYGYFPLMALRNCPIQAASGCKSCDGGGELTDRTGTRFRVACSGGDVAELFNSVPVYLADRMDELRGLDFVTLYFTGEDWETVKGIVDAYAKGLPQPGQRNAITRGLYYRKVL